MTDFKEKLSCRPLLRQAGAFLAVGDVDVSRGFGDVVFIGRHVGDFHFLVREVCPEVGNAGVKPDQRK